MKLSKLWGVLAFIVAAILVSSLLVDFMKREWPWIVFGALALVVIVGGGYRLIRILTTRTWHH